MPPEPHISTGGPDTETPLAAGGPDTRITLVVPSNTLEQIWTQFGIRPQENKLEHTAYVVLLDSTGRQRIGFPFDKLTPEGLAHDLRRLEQSDTPT